LINLLKFWNPSHPHLLFYRLRKAWAFPFSKQSSSPWQIASRQAIQLSKQIHIYF
jgi:hypothetical protein